ncbi:MULTISPECIES: heat shock protein transcriptional repressor HspR [Kitasatospora]|uniref:Helix-turn-helix domain-containing protein n=1 Tax=Kitasatospora cathayae TaxID=3004092 RepID=A0ABY7Q5K9_9ACTN|nr:helix-turn-helix domain-containing protein [Kitasatospora sp. HUAS 3-15]WBP87949.1 helix-turn-helix domain-containing protein [Kitasatospora sp. HUAS 3-15]
MSPNPMNPTSPMDAGGPIGPGLGEGLPGNGPRRTRRTTAAPPQYVLTEDTPVYVISVAAELSGLHPQTLRQYDRLGLVCPDRTAGRGRRYSARDIQQLREVQRLSQDEGINLAGIKRIIELENQVTALQARITELADSLEGAATALQQREAAVHASYRRDLVPYQPPTPQSSALVVWRPKR